jgi:transposase
MKNIESKVKQEVKRMTRYEIIGKAIRGELKWIEAANILQVSARHMLRLRERHEKFGIEGLRDKRTGRRMPSRIPKKEVEEVCRLKRDVYPDFTTKHFHRFAVAKHGVKMSYSWALTVLQARGLVTPERSRGTYRRRRERRAMFGMMLHQDASTHTWIAGVPMQDLVVTFATQRRLGLRRILSKMGRLRGCCACSEFGIFARGRRKPAGEVSASLRQFKDSSCPNFGLREFGPMTRRTSISRRAMCPDTTGGTP